LQPLVENAIKHGLNPKLLGGTITIRTRRQGDKIIITVEDDGVGFNVQSKREGSVGMDNVRFRLKQLAEGEMYVTSTEGVGTVVTVIVPEIKKE
jgi:two-component system LytT family sensor kinase